MYLGQWEVLQILEGDSANEQKKGHIFMYYQTFGPLPNGHLWFFKSL